MSDRPGRPTSLGGAAMRCLACAGNRLDGRWDDPSAWRIVCEELSRAWSGDPRVAWVAVLARAGLGPADASSGLSEAGAVFWSAATDRTRWIEESGSPAFWSSLAPAPGGVLTGRGEPPFITGMRLPTDRAATAWIACSVPGPHAPNIAFVAGYDDVGTDERSGSLAEHLKDELSAAATLTAPLVGMQRRIAELSTVAATSRSECEALSRMGELRARMAAITAHELKTPLTSITAYAEVLEQQADDPDFAHAVEFLHVIRGEADRLLRMVDRLLDSSRSGRGPALIDPRPVSVEPLCEEVRRIVAPQAMARDLHLGVHVPEGLPHVDGDVDLVRQVLLNLLGNALKFTPAGGRVTISAREEASTVRLMVSDSGPGIAPHELRAIFQSFYRTRSASRVEGVGLGLSIVKEIVSLHDGHLDVHSRPGRGSTFGVHLPKELQFDVENTALSASGCDTRLQLRLAKVTLRMVAELAASRGVVVMLPAVETGDLIAAAVSGMGPDVVGTRMAAGCELAQRASRQAHLVHECDDLPVCWAGIVDRPAGAMVAPLRVGDRVPSGLILAARRLRRDTFDGDDLLLMRILSEIVGKAWSIALAQSAAPGSQELVTEALAALTGLHRSGVPTADPLALRVLSRTGRRLGLSAFEIRLLQYAGALHDAGMVMMDQDVLHKTTELDLDERDHIGLHPQRGLDLLGSLVELPELRAIIRHHHERVDGLGYPEGRRGAEIPLGSRILAVVDAFFAMIRSRPWREGLTVAQSVAEIQRHAGSQFDVDVVTGFLATLLEEGLISPESLQRTAGDTAWR